MKANFAVGRVLTNSTREPRASLVALEQLQDHRRQLQGKWITEYLRSHREEKEQAALREERIHLEGAERQRSGLQRPRRASENCRAAGGS